MEITRLVNEYRKRMYKYAIEPKIKRLEEIKRAEEDVKREIRKKGMEMNIWKVFAIERAIERYEELGGEKSYRLPVMWIGGYAIKICKVYEKK